MAASSWRAGGFASRLHGVVRVGRGIPEQRNDVAVAQVDNGAVVHGGHRRVVRRRAVLVLVIGGEAAFSSGIDCAAGAARAARGHAAASCHGVASGPCGPLRPLLATPRGPTRPLACIKTCTMALAGSGRRRLALAGMHGIDIKPGGHHVGCHSAPLAADFRWAGAFPLYKLQGPIGGLWWNDGGLFL